MNENPSSDENHFNGRPSVPIMVDAQTTMGTRRIEGQTFVCCNALTRLLITPSATVIDTSSLGLSGISSIEIEEG
jgi:hypothetical protein